MINLNNHIPDWANDQITQDYLDQRDREDEPLAEDEDLYRDR